MFKLLLKSSCAFSLIIGLSVNAFSQESDYHKIPEEFKKHPEYGVLKMDGKPDSKELIHLRTRNSRTFEEGSGTYHTVSTAGTFHFKNEADQWISIQDKISKSAGTEYGIFRTELPIKINYNSGKTEMVLEKKGKSIAFGENSSMQFLGKDGLVLESYTSSKAMPEPTVSGNQLILKDFLPGLNRVQEIEYWSVRTDYFIEKKLEMPANTKFLQITDQLTIPNNWKIEYGTGEMTPLGWNGDLLIVNEKGGLVSSISRPLYYDSFKSKIKSEVGSHLGLGTYQLTKTKTGYTVQLLVPASWLNQDDLVYPLVIDPTTNNTYVSNLGLYELSGFNASCQADMLLNFPPTGGYIVTGTNTNYRIWAKGFIYTNGFSSNYADRVEQQSKVGSVNGWSAIQSGTGVNHNSTDPNYFTAANNGEDYAMYNLAIANGCYSDRATIPYYWQGYQTFFPHTGSVPAVAQQSGCTTAYQELVANTWYVIATYLVAPVSVVPAALSYPGSNFCLDLTSVAATQTGTSGGLYSATPAGLTINSADGTLNPSTSTPGTYVVTYAVGTYPCSSTSNVTIAILDLVTPTFAPIPPVCLGSTFTLPTSSTNTVPVTGTWSPAINSSATTTYTFTPNAGECALPITMTVAVFDLTLVTNTTQSLCGIASGTATVVASGGVSPYTYSWSPSGGTTANAANLGAGTYTVSVVDSNGCSKSQTAIVTAVDGPTASISSTSNVSCFGGSNGAAALVVTGGTTPYTYAWTPSVGSTPSITNLIAGTYSVVVTDGLGCTSDVQLTISQPADLVVSTTGSDSYCGTPSGSALASVSGGTAPYSSNWMPGNLAGASATNLVPGSYLVTVTDGNGCTKTASYAVNSTGSIPVTVTPATSFITEGDVVNLTVSTTSALPGLVYSWSPPEGLSCTDCPNPIASPVVSTNYEVVVSSPDGCIGKASANITVKIICGEYFIPTIFSPNGDGNNDEFSIYGKCIIGMDLKIYNRWGELVFETTEPKNSWNGMFRGEIMNPGTFVYTVKLNFLDGTSIRKGGNINLVR
ncbi:MAG: gliding motility-associated C-terminal domain-containing protein [Crocinitomicaceae bacterium]|nr:gliding motility-associated C-terminal domain-containing protein [Crocinitomicaceae bacterium]